MNETELRKKTDGFISIDIGGIKLYKIPSFLREGILKHGFTTRVGGVSEDCYRSLNLSKTREEDERNKSENYQRVCDALGVEYNSLTLVNYAHGDSVRYVAEPDRGKGMSRESDFAPCDGLVTNHNKITLLTLHADCAPVFMADASNRGVGVCHAGWRGVSRNIISSMIDAFMENLGCEPKNILAGIGPHIMDCCFEVSEDVASIFRQFFHRDIVTEREKKLYVNLQKAMMTQFEQAGVPPENISCANLCTSCRDDLFFSHRRDRGMTGAMAALIAV